MNTVSQTIPVGAEDAPSPAAEPPCPRNADWPWWWSTDEERYHGPCNSRADAIMEAWSEGERGTIFVMQAVHGGVYTDILNADDILERFDEANYEIADGDGDPLSADIPGKAWKDLAANIDAQIKALVHKHGVKPWGFAEQTRGEAVDLAEPSLATLPTEARAILAELCAGWSSKFGYAESYTDTLLRDLKNALAPEIPTPADSGEAVVAGSVPGGPQ